MIQTFKNMKKIDLFCILKVTEVFDTDPHSHLDPLVRGTDPHSTSGFVQKCHGSGTLVLTMKNIVWIQLDAIPPCVCV